MLENLEIRPEDILSPNDPDAIDKIVAENVTTFWSIEKKMKRWTSFNKMGLPCRVQPPNINK
jgi:hypothetical protein